MEEPMITEVEPQFAVTVRGYDRAQVDDYVDSLREWCDNAMQRVESAESENSRLHEELAETRGRLAQLERKLGDGPPRTMAALGDRVGQILVLAEEVASTLRADSEAEAVAIIGRARQEGADLVRGAQSRQADMEAFISTAGEKATALVQQAEARGEDAANRLVTDAEAWAANREAQSTERARVLVADAEAQRDRILTLLETKRNAVQSELERLISERDGVRDGLSRLRESLRRTVSEISGEETSPQPS
jgi:cell division septum initiation protein DivIVA